MEDKKNRFTYQNQYIRERYDRINFLLPKGDKEKVKKRAVQLGMSVNEYLKTLIDNDIRNSSHILE